MKLDPSPRFSADDGRLYQKLSILFRSIAQQVNDLSEGRITANYSAQAAMPTAGTWQKGDFIRNTTPTVTGGAGNKYVIFGWSRITSGSANVLDTDWVEVRTLTGA